MTAHKMEGRMFKKIKDKRFVVWEEEDNIIGYAYRVKEAKLRT